MPTLNQDFLFNVESRMRIIANPEYQRLNAETHWREVAKELPSDGRKERLLWLLDTAGIDYVSALGGEIEESDQVTNTTEFEAKAATGGLRLNRFQMEDSDGGGIEAAANWARGAAAYAAYWPEKQVWKAVCAGDQAGNVTYDTKKFFDLAHPVNPFDSSAGTFDNVFKTSGGTGGPGAVPIDNSVTADVALTNLVKAISYIRKIKMPNGVDPRKLRAAKLFVPPSMIDRATQLTSSKFIAQAAASGGGSADIQTVISALGIPTPVVVDEISAAMPNGSDTSYYLGVETTMSDNLGALVYVNREPFQIIYNNGMTDADLQRANSLQWTTRGRNVVGYGHPYLLFKCMAS